jgi:uncharacterized protein with NAD-binding domain and iron-sulfur cluster
VFGYRNGEIDKPNFAAGTAIRCTFRICFAYKGGIFWKMQAGMGDAVIAPLYLGLMKRGVKFEFFCRVQNLGLSGDKKSIETISIGRQATIKEVDIYYRANIDPSDRYVLSVSGSTSSRLTGYKSGFSNLYLAGDWTVNGLNAGCVEAATMSGKIIGNVLAGSPPLKDVWGYGDL